MTIIVLSSAKHLRLKPINRFLIHQSIIDLTVCFVTIFEEVIIHLDGMVQPFLCHYVLTKTTTLSILYVSTYNMTFMTIERHLAITKPLHYDVDKVRRRLPFVFTFTWLFGFAVLLFIPVTTVIKNGVCLPAHKMIGTPLMSYYSPHAFVIALVIPLSVMIVCYARMYIALR